MPGLFLKNGYFVGLFCVHVKVMSHSLLDGLRGKTAGSLFKVGKDLGLFCRISSLS